MPKKKRRQRSKKKNTVKLKPKSPVKKNTEYKKKPIPRAVKEQVWIKYCGRKFSRKCYIRWCKNKINVFDFHVGHDRPESRGGTMDINNLKPLCSRCNHSMSNNYTIKEWNALHKRKLCCLF